MKHKLSALLARCSLPLRTPCAGSAPNISAPAARRARAASPCWATARAPVSPGPHKTFTPAGPQATPALPPPRMGRPSLPPLPGYRFSMDAVLLAHFVRPRPGWRILDLGCGCGVVGLIAAYRVPSCTVTLLERQPELARLAAANDRDRKSVV